MCRLLFSFKARFAGCNSLCNPCRQGNFSPLKPTISSREVRFKNFLTH